MVRVGMIGCGMITKVRHAPEYFANPDCEIVGYSDPVTHQAEELAARYGGTVFPSVEAMLDAGVDAVSVCAHNAVHCELTVKMLEAGCHVLCEKPMATTPEECELMAKTAEKTGKILMIGHNQRLSAAHKMAYRMIRAGAIGDVLTIDTRFCHEGPERWSKNNKETWFFKKGLAKFGAMGDLGVHKLDSSAFLVGSRIKEISAKLCTLNKRYEDGSFIDVDDNAFCQFTFENGAVGSMHVSWTNYGPEDNATVIYGSQGAISLFTDPKYTLIYKPLDGEVQYFERGDKFTTEDREGNPRYGTSGVIDEFIDCILQGRKPVCDGRDAYQTMKAVFAAIESDATGRYVEVKY